ncbi:MAG: prohibitin family protein [Alphaproteobacteria bacterium]|nr:prohibitin family protein [Alphaproteobacteria bacterium]
MTTLRKLLFIGITAILGAGCAPYTLESTEIGVRTNLVLSKGVQKEFYSPGSTVFLPVLITEWSVFDIALQNLEMSREPTVGDRFGDDSLRFKTIDGNDISVNVTISWRIDPQKGWYLLQFIGEDTQMVEDVLVRPVSRTVIRDVLNELGSEEYYNADRRFAKAEEAKRYLNHYLNPEGVVVEQMLLGEHRFNPKYEQVIKDMKVAEQDAARLQSETEAAVEQMKRELEVARGKAHQDIETAKGSSEQRTLEADAIYFERQRQAEAILAEKQAEAQGLTEKARALSGSGGRSMVKLEVARQLQGKTIVFIPASSGMDVRTTDVNSLLNRYGVAAVAKPSE